MFDQNHEIGRLLDLMSASGRMQTKIISKPHQSLVIDTPFPYPWHNTTRKIYINFDLWQGLSRAQRDLILLRSVSWLINIKWFEFNWYQALTILSLAGVIIEFLQSNAIGVIMAGGLTTFALNQIWRKNRSQDKEIEADEMALKIALRRGYNQTEATQALWEGIQEVAKIEGRVNLTLVELLRLKNLKRKITFNN